MRHFLIGAKQTQFSLDSHKPLDDLSLLDNELPWNCVPTKSLKLDIHPSASAAQVEYFYSKEPARLDKFSCAQMRDQLEFNNKSLDQLNLLLNLQTSQDRLPREAEVTKTGYELVENGIQTQSYEFDSKSFLNSYYAFINRHNSNSLEPDPVCVSNLKALSQTFFQHTTRKLLGSVVEPISVLDWLAGKNNWTPSKKN